MIGVSVSGDAIAAARAAHEQAMRAQAQAQLPPPSVAQPEPVPAQQAIPGGARTMLGVAFTPPGASGSAFAGAALPSTPVATMDVGQPKTAPEVPLARSRTMLGVAMPGIAPTGGGAAPPGASALDDTPLAPPAQPPGQMRGGGTMLGVAIPGIAPTNPGYAGTPAALSPPPGSAPAQPVRSRVSYTAVSQSAVVPAPAPYVDDVALPQAPVREKKGVPLALVVGIIAALVLVGGVLIVLFKPVPRPIDAQPRLDPQGNEILHLKCEDCADGTTVALDTAKATFKAKETDLALVTPLNVGVNNLTLKIDRPGSGRDEDVKLIVPLGFFIHPDLAGIGAKPPVITVRVAAVPGTEVHVDGKPLTLDASGKGAYAVDVSGDTEGATDDTRIIDRKIPYEVIMAGDKNAGAGVVSARIAIVPLRVDAPSAHQVVDTASFTIAGQTVAGGAVTIDGQVAPTQADGSFADTRTSPPAGGETSLELRASAQGRAPRTVHVTVKRVASVDAEAKAAEATSLLTYDQIAPDIASKVGQRAVIAGEVLESRVTGHQTIALVNDTRGCKSGPCLSRVIGSEDAKMGRGAMVRAYGTVTRAVTTASGKTVPELAADFVARGKR